MRSIIWVLEFIISLLFTVPFLISAKRIKKEHGAKAASEYSDRIVRRWVENKFKIAGADIRIKGVEKIPLDRKIVFISNHQSNFDIAIIMKYIPGAKGFAAKIEMKKIPIMAKWMELIGCVFIDRESPRKSIEAIVQAGKNVKEGINMVIFPEGHRSKGGPVADFKLGSFKFALKSKAVIIPITIDGSYKLLEEKKRIRPAKVNITVHDPIYTEELDKEEKEKINDTVRDIIISSMSKGE